MRKRKSGDTSTARRAKRTASSNASPRASACVKSFISRSICAGSTGRRKARATKRARFCRAASAFGSTGPGRTGATRSGLAAASSVAAVARYFSTSTGGVKSVAELLSKPPPPPPSGGKASAGRVSSPSRSRMVWLYSARLSRCGTGGPGSGGSAAGSGSFSALSSQATTRWRSSSVGCGLLSGGIASSRSSASTRSHSPGSRYSAASACRSPRPLRPRRGRFC